MKIIQWVVDQHARSLAGNYYRRCGLFAFIAQCPDGEYQASTLLGAKYSIPSHGAFAAGSTTECIIPGGFRATAVPRDDHPGAGRSGLTRSRPAPLGPVV